MFLLRGNRVQVLKEPVGIQVPKAALVNHTEDGSVAG
jgi:hypothetical protein